MEKAGKIYRYGDDVNTDVIIPARFLTAFDTNTLRAHCMEDIDQNFSKTVEVGDVIIAGKNFGSGSSREHAPLAIKASGIQAIIAKSFARIFYRNAINIGLLVIEDEALVNSLEKSKQVKIDYINKLLIDDNGQKYSIELPPFVIDILEAGGLVNAVKEDKLRV